MINALGPSEALIVAPLELAFAKIAGKKVAASASLVTDGLPGRSVYFGSKSPTTRSRLRHRHVPSLKSEMFSRW